MSRFTRPRASGTHRALALGLLLSLSTLAQHAEADPAAIVDASRIRVADIVSGAPEAWAGVDLGPAPPPGSSRLISRDEVRRTLEAAGFAGTPRMPATVRVTSAAKRWSVTELEDLLTEPVTRALPPGVTLTRLKCSRGAVTSPRARVGQVKLAVLPRREGSVTSVATVELVQDGELAERVLVRLSLELSAEAARPLLERGAAATLVIERGAAQISARGIALSAGDLNEVIAFRVSSTNKILSARVESAERARVVER